MKILHICIGGRTGAPTACRRLDEALQKKGIESKVLNIDKAKKKRNGKKLNQFFYTAKNRLLYGKSKIQKGYPFVFGESGVIDINNEEISDADIIHLHWICDVISIQDIYNLTQKGKKIVWTCHDSWAFTGGCCVKMSCNKYQEHCGKCPFLNANAEKDMSYHLFEKKKSYFQRCDITYIAPSKWMKKNIETSKILLGKKCVNIPNPINLDIFRHYGEQETEKRLGFCKEQNKINVLFGASAVDIPYKGFDDLVQMLELLQQANSVAADNLVLHIIGSGRKPENKLKDFEIREWGQVVDEEKLACIYSIADVFILPTLDDNLPNMVMESMACETPVLSYPIGGIPDMIIHKENGYLAKYNDFKDLYQGLLWIINHNEENLLGINARKKISAFSEEKIADKFHKLYCEILNESIC